MSKNQYIYIYTCAFKMTCGKDPYLNPGHWSGSLGIQGLLSTDRCLPDSKSCPEIIKEPCRLVNNVVNTDEYVVKEDNYNGIPSAGPRNEVSL